MTERDTWPTEAHRWRAWAATVTLDVTIVWLLAVAAAIAFKLFGGAWRTLDGVDRDWVLTSALLGIVYLWGRRAAGIRFVPLEQRPAGTRFPPRAAEPEPGLAPVVRVHLSAAQAAERRLRAAAPDHRVGREIDALMALIGRTADHAQLLHQALKDIPVARVEARIGQLAAEPEAVERLNERLAVQRRMQMQLTRFYDEMERAVAGLDAIRDRVLTGFELLEREALIDEVQSLHEEMSSVATGMSYAV
jgi:hypothetical protein